MNSRFYVFCVCKDLLPLVESFHRKLTPCPDHQAVIMCIKCEDKKRASGYWKLNTSVLTEERYRDVMQNTIASSQQINDMVTS